MQWPLRGSFLFFLPLSCAQSTFQNTNVITEYACQGKSFASEGRQRGRERKDTMTSPLDGFLTLKLGLSLSCDLTKHFVRRCPKSRNKFTNRFKHTREPTETSFLMEPKHTLEDLGCLYSTAPSYGRCLNLGVREACQS